MFLDEVIIEVEAGKGGDGVISFRREKYVPKGGPDGGCGGRGGDVILKASIKENTLTRYLYKKKFKAEDGKKGGSTNRTGRNGTNLILYVPCGTVVYLEDGEILADITEENEGVIIAKGGRGGAGNSKFATSKRQTPRICEKGERGEKKKIRLVLKLIADIGIIGLPNAGKSTLLSRISNARPKIADYPFTTLEPVLGIVILSDYRSMVFAELPGLIEGSSKGTGLGDKFLKHAERTKMLLHLIDSTNDDILKNYYTIRKELKYYSEALYQKKEIVVINKCDAITDSRKSKIENIFNKKKIEIKFISAVTGDGVNSVLESIYKKVKDIKLKKSKIKKTYQFIEPFYIEQNEGKFALKGDEFEKLVERYDLSNPDSLRYFYQLMKKKGWEEKIKEAGISNGDEVIIKDNIFTYHQLIP
ncbi:MAG: GTPase ObgE [Candidatus Hydrogenedentota bacterium]